MTATPKPGTTPRAGTSSSRAAAQQLGTTRANKAKQMATATAAENVAKKATAHPGYSTQGAVATKGEKEKATTPAAHQQGARRPPQSKDRGGHTSDERSSRPRARTAAAIPARSEKEKNV